jgi:hypothetical protein
MMSLHILFHIPALRDILILKASSESRQAHSDRQFHILFHINIVCREVQCLHDRCCRNVSAHSHVAGQQRLVTHPDVLLGAIKAVNTLFACIRSRRG